MTTEIRDKAATVAEQGARGLECGGEFSSNGCSPPQVTPNCSLSKKNLKRVGG